MEKVKVEQEEKTQDDLGVSRQDFLSVLNKARVAVDQKGLIGLEQAQHFIIRDDRVITYNDRIAVSAPIGAKLGMELTVQADDLYKVLSDIPEEFVQMELDEDENLLVSSATTKSGMASMPLEGELLELVDSLKLDKLKRKDWQDLPKNFIEAIKLCGFSVSKDAANVAYSSIFVDNDGMGDGVVYSTDKWRISRYSFDEGAAMTFLLPYDAAKELIKYSVVEIQQKGAWAHFRDKDGLVFSVRTVDVDFPDCEKYFEVKGEKMKLPSGLVKALEQILVFAPGEDLELREAEITFRKGKITIRSQNDRGWIERKITVPGLNVPKNMPSLVINPVFFVDILKHSTTMITGENRALFSAGNFEHVMVLPVSNEEE